MEVGHLSLDRSSAAMPTPLLDFANICLCNALYLLPAAATTTNETMVSALPYPPLHGDDVMSLRASILANSSYVSLRQGDQVSSLHYSKGHSFATITTNVSVILIRKLCQFCCMVTLN